MISTQHPRWCSPFHCVIFTTSQRTGPNPNHSTPTRGQCLFQWVRVDFDDTPGTVRLDLIDPLRVAA